MVSSPTATPTVLSVSGRGVFWDRKNCRWRSQVGFQNKKIFMGYFNDAEDAARAYDRKLVELHGSTGKHGPLIAPCMYMLVLDCSCR